MALSNIKITNDSTASCADFSTYDNGITHVLIKTNSSYVGFVERYNSTYGRPTCCVTYTDVNGVEHTDVLMNYDKGTVEELRYGRSVSIDLPNTDTTTVINVRVYAYNYSNAFRMSTAKWIVTKITHSTSVSAYQLSPLSLTLEPRKSADKFKTVTIYVETSENTWVGVPMTIAADGSSASVAEVNCYPCGRYWFEIVWDSDTPKTVTVNNNIANTTESHTYNADNNTLDLTVTCTAGYVLYNASLQYTDTDGVQQTQAITGTESTIQITVLADSTVTIAGYTASEYITIEDNLTDCTRISVDSVKRGHSLLVRLEPNSGFKFVALDTPFLQFKDSTGGYQKQYGVLYDGGEYCLLTFDTSALTRTTTKVTVVGVGYVSQPVTSEYGSINIYKVTEDNLNDFANERFFKETSESTSAIISISTDVDLAEYVVSLKKIYLNVPTGQIDTIKCGNYITDIQANQPAVTKYTLDFGTVSITAHNNSSVDFDGELQLFLPFVGLQSIPIDYVGKDLQLSAEVDIVSGTGVYKVTCNGIIIAIIDFECSRNVMYRTYDVTPVGGIDYSSKLSYGLTPYVVHKYFTDKQTTVNEQYEEVTLNEVSGYNVITKVAGLTADNMTVTEYDEIITLLENGVIL